MSAIAMEIRPAATGIARSFETLWRDGSAAGRDDGELLERFRLLRPSDPEAAGRAFATLVERHGPMVRRVCRGILRDPHAADDAFQAVFLVLARKAGSLRADRPLAPWLSGVAWRVARQARDREARRRRREARVAPPASYPAPSLGEPAVWEELARLAEPYRLAVLLCDVEGLTHSEAAARLSLPAGTIKSRQSRGRHLLRSRLSRLGLGDTPALLLASPREILPEALISSVTSAAAALTTTSSPAIALPSVVLLLATATIATALGLAARPTPPPPPGPTTAPQVAIPPIIPTEPAEAPQGGSDLRVQVLDPEGQPTQSVSLLLWRRLGADEPADSFVWIDPTTGDRWAYSRNWNDGYPAPDPFGFSDLPAGTYRVSASRFTSDSRWSGFRYGPGPLVVSAPVVLDGTSPIDLVLNQEGGGLFSVSVQDRLTGFPVPGALVRVRRLSDGFPTFRGWGNGQFADRAKNGDAFFPFMPPGRYSVEFLGRRATQFGQIEYEPVADPVLIISPGEDNERGVRKTLLVDGRPLTRDEIAQRWPYIIRGTVTDPQGRPLPGVKLTASAGMGTLFPTGETTSGPDGSYLLRFSPGAHMAAESLGLNAVVLGATLPGYFPLDLARDPSFLAVRREPTPEEREEMKLADPSRLIVAERPLDLDLVMIPSARARFDLDSFPVERRAFDYRVSVEPVEPSLSNNSLPMIIPNLYRDDPTFAGLSAIADLPPGRYRFTLSWPAALNQPPVTTQEIHLNQTGPWSIVLFPPNPKTPTILPASFAPDTEIMRDSR